MNAKANCEDGKKIRKRLLRAAKRVKRSLLLTLSIFADNRQIMLRVGTLGNAQSLCHLNYNGIENIRVDVPKQGYSKLMESIFLLFLVIYSLYFPNIFLILTKNTL
jgi:hypothetical protein